MKYTTGYKHQLAESLAVSTGIHPGMPVEHEYFHLSIAGTLTIREGYAWDGASGGCPDNDYTLTPSLIHDILYQAMRLGLLPQETRRAADQVFYTMCRDRGLNWLTAKFYLKALHRFGASSADPQNKKEVLEVP